MMARTGIRSTRTDTNLNLTRKKRNNMKYLVNRETKEHLLYDSVSELFNIRGWKIVEADSEGWIPWSGGECPLPDYCAVETKNHDGNIFAAGSAYRGAWPLVAFYRPILTEQAEPVPAPLYDPRSVSFSLFERLRAATDAASTIAALLAEIDAMLPDGYQVVRVEKVEVALPADPAEDMSDWRNWKEGDLVVRNDDDPCDFWTGKSAYEIEKICGSLCVRDDDGNDYRVAGDGFFKFHSRPTGASK